jgi:hypothetical protein
MWRAVCVGTRDAVASAAAGIVESRGKLCRGQVAVCRVCEEGVVVDMAQCDVERASGVADVNARVRRVQVSAISLKRGRQAVYSC